MMTTVNEEQFQKDVLSLSPIQLLTIKSWDMFNKLKYDKFLFIYNQTQDIQKAFDQGSIAI